MILLHITADDLGISQSVNQAITTAAAGLITDTAVMINTQLIDETCSTANNIPGVSPGLHLTLTWGQPVSSPHQVPSLVNVRGDFHDLNSFLLRYLVRHVSLREIKREFTAQCEQFITRIGPITSLSSHQHLHLLPRVLPIVHDLARRYRVPWVRPHHELQHPGRHCLPRGLAVRDRLSMESGKSHALSLMSRLSPSIVPACGFIRFRRLPGRSHLESLRLLLLGLPAGRWELVCHPCNPDPDYPPARHHLPELNCLTADTIHRLCSRLGITITACGGQATSQEVPGSCGY